MQEWRCVACRRLLAKVADDARGIEIKCKCGAMNARLEEPVKT